MTRDAMRAEHLAMEQAFVARCAELGLKPNPVLFWYHSLDLGSGLITPGSFDYRETISNYGFAPRMNGTRALDVGSGSGFFAFEMERRGAEVTSVELPSLLAWDRFPGVPPDQIIATIRRELHHHTMADYSDFIRTASHAEIYTALIDGPFRFCHAVLESGVTRRYGRIYDLPDMFRDAPKFNLVMMGDILVHLIDPLQALASAAAVCDGTLVIAQALWHSDQPEMHWVAAMDTDNAEWWRPNLAWFQHVLPRLGFPIVEVAGEFTSRIRPNGDVFEKTVIHARRA